MALAGDANADSFGYHRDKACYVRVKIDRDRSPKSRIWRRDNNLEVVRRQRESRCGWWN